MKKPWRSEFVIWGFAGLAVALLLLQNLVSHHVLETLVKYQIPIAFASLFVLTGHAFRVQRTRTLLSAAGAESSFNDQVVPLAVGLMFNVFVPLKLGEFARALLISRVLNISKIYAISVVVVERLMDIALAAWALSAAVLVAGNKPTQIWLPFALGAGSVSTLALVFLTLVVRENRIVFTLIAKLSGLFNPAIEYRMQHSTYSVIHGFQVFLRSKRDTLWYFFNFVFSWLFYVAASLTLVVYVLGQKPTFTGLLSPFVAGGNLINSPNVIEFSHSIAAYLNLMSAEYSSDTAASEFGLAAWLSLQGIVAVVGLVALFFLARLGRTKKDTLGKSVSRIDRSVPVARRLSTFMELYFERQNLARNFHAEDVRGESEIVGFFKGGSDAITALIRKSGELRVRKTIDLKNRDKLRGQYLWLKRHQSHQLIVTAIEERTKGSLYSIDLEFNSKALPFFEYIHSNPINRSEARLEEVLTHLSSSVWKITSNSCELESLKEYLDSRLFRRIENAITSNSQLREIYEAKRIVINGVELLNLKELLSEILGTQSGMERIALHRVNEQMHGDLTIDNVLIDLDTNLPIIIDPSDDNEYRSTALEFARMRQSLAGGYEFCNEYEGAPDVSVDKENSVAGISYFDATSQVYSALDFRLLTIARTELTEAEFESLDFFTGVFFARMLDHRIKINPLTAPIYYAKSVQFLSRYLKAIK